MLTFHEMVVLSVIWRNWKKKPNIASIAATEFADPTFDRFVANNVVDKLLDNGYVSRDNRGDYTITEAGVKAFSTSYASLSKLMPGFKLLVEGEHV